MQELGQLRHDYGVFPGDSCVPFPDFGGGSYQATYGDSTYHGLQTKLEDQFSNGLTFLLTYTWSKTMSDAGDLLNGGTTGGLRAYTVSRTWTQVRLGASQLRHPQRVPLQRRIPVALRQRQEVHEYRAASPTPFWVGGPSTGLSPLQGGQPLNFGCPTGTISGTGCNDVLVSGQSQQRGIKTKVIDGGPRPFWLNNAAAFNQPCQAGRVAGQYRADS